jgi:hypothetical protein
MENKRIEKIRSERLKKTEEQLIQLGCSKCIECGMWSDNSYIRDGICKEYKEV